MHEGIAEGAVRTLRCLTEFLILERGAGVEQAEVGPEVVLEEFDARGAHGGDYGTTRDDARRRLLLRLPDGVGALGDGGGVGAVDVGGPDVAGAGEGELLSGGGDRQVVNGHDRDEDALFGRSVDDPDSVLSRAEHAVVEEAAAVVRPGVLAAQGAAAAAAADDACGWELEARPHAAVLNV